MKAYPRQLMVELSRKCNLRCVNCYHEDAPGEIDLYTFKRLIGNIAQAYRAAGEVLPILYPWFLSEPLMTPNLRPYLEAATGLGYRINLTTNGVIGSQWKDILAKDVDYHILVFSIDGYEPQTYHAIRDSQLGRVYDSLREATTIISRENLDIPICVKLTNKGIEWAEVVGFVGFHLASPFVKMVSVSRAFGDSDGPLVKRHPCRYLSEFFIIQHDLTIAPCCMRGRAIREGMGNVDVDDPMGSFLSSRRQEIMKDMECNTPAGHCLGCTSAYTGDMVEGTVDGKPFGKSGVIRTRQDFYNMFYFNPDYRGN